MISARKLISGITVPFYSDGYRLSIIRANLISNAIKYCDEGKDNSFIQVSATITPPMPSSIFSTTGWDSAGSFAGDLHPCFIVPRKKSEGAGLGLYIVKETLERLHGRIAVTSRLGEGTDITLTLPNALLKENGKFSFLPQGIIEEVPTSLSRL